MTRRVIIIGGGVAGLAAAGALRRRGMETLCLESSARAGGMLATTRRDGFLAEHGPHSFRIRADEEPESVALPAVASRLIFADTKRGARLVTRNGAPATIARAAGFGGVLRALAEPLVPRSADRDESAAEFCRRLFGEKMYSRVIDAALGGVFAGDPEKISARRAFPTPWDWSRGRGVIAGALATRFGAPARVASFPEGMGEFASLLAADLSDSLIVGTTVTEIARTPGGWRVRRETGGAARDESADAVIVATPAHAWKNLPLPPGCEGLARAGAAMPHPPVAVVTLGYPRGRTARPLDGFGVLSPACEKRDALGVLFASSIFPGRAPDGAVTLAVFIGGRRRPELAGLPEPELAQIAARECESLLGATGAPEFTHVAKHARGIPQYELDGYENFLAELAATESALPGLKFAGSHRGGIALGATLREAEKLAAELAG